jgi:hypothetical protein
VLAASLAGRAPRIRQPRLPRPPTDHPDAECHKRPRTGAIDRPGPIKATRRDRCRAKPEERDRVCDAGNQTQIPTRWV